MVNVPSETHRLSSLMMGESLGEALPATYRARDIRLAVDERDPRVAQLHQVVDCKSHPELVGTEVLRSTGTSARVSWP
jgi:hypothetical protein